MQSNFKAVPTQIGRYQILDLLGQGGIGSVYRAYDPDLDRNVVIKLITSATPNFDQQWRARFRQEVQAASQLNHPHIITIHDVNLDNPSPYVVMELLTGGTLKKRLAHKSLTWQETLILGRLLAQALAYAHNTGVIHRDIKPANVMFAAADLDTLKLVDFGLAYRQGKQDLSQVGDVIGTPAYMSPEQARAELVDHRTDIFALGILLFEAIAGYNPLDKGSPMFTLDEIISEAQIDMSPLVNKAPPEVINLIQQAVAKNREERYQTCEELLGDLDRCLGSLPDITITRSASLPKGSQSLNSPDIRLAGNVSLHSDIAAVLRAMFDTFSQVAVEAEFDRGFSGSHVFRVRLIEKGGRAHLPAVVKIAPIGLIQAEWRAYQTWVENTLPNIAHLQGEPTSPAGSLWGGLRYSLIGGGTFATQNLFDYCQMAEVEDLCWILENRLFEIMGANWWLDNRTDRAFQMQTDYDGLLPVNLIVKPSSAPFKDDVHLIESGNISSSTTIHIGQPIQLKGFVVTKVDPQRRQVTLNLPSTPAGERSASYRLRLDSVSDIERYRRGQVIDPVQGEVIATRYSLLMTLASQAMKEAVDLSANQLTLSDSLTLPNPLATYPTLLQEFLIVNISTIHGDLNLENILVDPATRDISVIDFATTCQGHALRDLLRLETEIILKLIPPALVEAGLSKESIVSLYEQLDRATRQQPSSISFTLPAAGLEKPFQILRVIRKMARKCLFDSDNWREYYQGLVLHLLGALKFNSLDALPTAPLPRQIAFLGAATALQLLETPSTPQQFPRKSHWRAAAMPVSNVSAEIETPYGTMRPDSRFYIERAADEHCWEHISKPHATLFIQAPRQVGKSSLMRRSIHRAEKELNKRAAFIDLQELPKEYFTSSDEENFLVEFCLMISGALKIPDAIDEYWRGRRANIIKCSLYLSDYIIPQVSEPFILAIDEVERMLTSPFRANFFGMLRTWHNKRAYDENFARMTLFLCSSTESSLLINDRDQSPFNVAEIISLADFTREEVAELNRRHYSPLSDDQVDELMTLIGGHPFLTRLALYQLATAKTDLKALLAQATADDGPFGDHLRRYRLMILEDSDLKQALTKICQGQTQEENQAFQRLKGAGLVKKAGQQVVPRNNLYARYFKEHLND